MTAFGRLVLSATGAAVVTIGVYLALRSELDVETDIVGYPTFANFNIEKYLHAYALLVLVFPPLTALIFFASARLRPLPRPDGRLPSARPSVEAPSAYAADARLDGVAVAARVLFVGAVLGLEVAVIRGTSYDRVLAIVAISAMVYGAVLVCLAFAISAVARELGVVRVLTYLNTIGAIASLPGLFWVSSATSVRVLEDSSTRSHDWFPLVIAVAIFFVAAGLAARGFLRARGVTGRLTIERNTLLLVAAPVAVFICRGGIPGALPPIDFFHEGEGLAPAWLVENGAFPWRDVLFIHGLLEDVASPSLGLDQIENSRWGAAAGRSVVYQPLAWVSLYYLCVYLFSTNVLFLAGTQLALLTNGIFAVQARFLLLPFALVALGALMARASWARATAFISLLIVQVVVAPEALIAAIAFLVVLVAFDLTYRAPEVSLLNSLARSGRCAAVGIAIVSAWFAVLGLFGALGDFLTSFSTFAGGHQLTGAIPFEVTGTGTRSYVFMVIAPIILGLGTVAFVATRIWARKPLAVHDWVMLGLAIFGLAYYTKFLARSDHIFQSFVVAIPLVFFALFRLVTTADEHFSRLVARRNLPTLIGRRASTIAVVLVVLATAPVYLTHVIRLVPRNYHPVVAAPPQMDRVGYLTRGGFDASEIRSIDRALDAALDPGDTIFDFTDSPALFHYLLELRPVTRYVHVSLALRHATQLDLISDLEKARPELVVFDSRRTGLGDWDGISRQVRHYAVSSYILDHYEPKIRRHGITILQRADSRTTEPQKRGTRWLTGSPCSWGYAPNFLNVGPPESASKIELTTAPEVANGRSSRWRLVPPRGVDLTSYDWLEIESTERFRDLHWSLTDRRSLDPLREISFATLPRSGSIIRVDVGACAQWRGFRSNPLYLTADDRMSIRAVRLIR